MQLNKRQKKKKLKKTLPLFADEFPLLSMTESELKSALEQAERFRLKYGYRKKYSNLKRKKNLLYFYSTGEKSSKSLGEIMCEEIRRIRSKNQD